MFINTRKLSIKLFLVVIFLFAVTTQINAQSQICPSGLICLTQIEANKAAENARLRVELENKIKVQNEALEAKDRSIKDVQDTAKKNENDLKDALQKTEIELATKTGQLISSEAEKVRLTAIIDFMLKNGRVKKIGLINIF